VELDVLANDRDPAAGRLELVGTSDARFGTLELRGGGSIVYTPARDRNGTDQFYYHVADSRGGFALGIATVEVESVNQPPIARPDHAITEEGTPVTIEPLENDVDPDGDLLTLAGHGQPTNGIVTLREGKLLVYEPHAAFHGVDVFSYTVTDVLGLRSEGLVSVLVKPVNQPPAVSDLAFVFNKNRTHSISFVGGDPDGDTLTFTVVEAPKHGDLFAYPTVATYQPKVGFSGLDSFTYVATDGRLQSAQARVTLTVLDVNNPPVATAASVTTKQARLTPIALAASDADHEPLRFRIVGEPEQGSVLLSGTNALYAPRAGFVGQDSFRFLVSDGRDDSPSATVSITVTDQNTAPRVSGNTLSVVKNTAASFRLEASDPESDPVLFQLIQVPRHGLLTGAGGQLEYTPARDFLGVDRLEFYATDGALVSSNAFVYFYVREPNTVPWTTNLTVEVIADRPLRIRLEAKDDDGDVLRAAILKGPRQGRVFGQGLDWTYVAAAGYVGGDVFSYKVWDGLAYSREARVTISVQPVLPEFQVSLEPVVTDTGLAMRLTLHSQPGSRFDIRTSTNLLDWSSLRVVTLEQGSLSLTDTNAAGMDTSFYWIRPF
jgi:hypothetical protein